MRNVLLTLAVSVLSAHAADSVRTWFEEGKTKGNIRYYYIETKKDSGASHTSAHANAVGGQLSYSTGNWNGFQMGVTFMTTNGFALPNVVDTSILGRDNAVRQGLPAGHPVAQESFSVLGEAFVKYSYKDLQLLYGRKVIKTSLVDAKDVRMLPSAVQGAFIDYKMPYGTTMGAAYLTHFKQRTSDKFVNIVKHALGNNTQAITGHDEGEVVQVDAVYQSDATTVKVYDEYAQDFMNALYLEAVYKGKMGEHYDYHVDAQYINQMSVGNADTNLQNDNTLAGGQIQVNAFGVKAGVKRSETALDVAWTKVLSDADKHDSLVLPWDGTPLFTNMITSNDLFQSNYGKALNADSIYIGGSQGIRLGYTQTYDFTGVKGFKTALSYLNISNDKFSNNQRDYNAVIAYGVGDFSLALKGIWVRYNTSASATGTIAQDDKLTQYRVIANYKF